jgi:hypothetical protein
MMNKFWVLLLIPQSLAGVLTGVALWHDPPTSTDDISQFVGFLALVGIESVGMIVWMWQHPSVRLYLGLSRVSWLLLIPTAYLAGLILMFMA